MMQPTVPQNRKTFGECVVELARSVPVGRVTTYGDLARAAGGTPMSVRSISNILGRAQKNGILDIPWHRIVYSNGKAWFSDQHKAERLKLYKREGIEINTQGHIVNFNTLRY